MTQVAKTNPGILMDALEKTSVEDILLTKPVWWNLRNELALRLLPV